MGHAFGPGGSECGLPFLLNRKKVIAARRNVRPKLKKAGEMSILGISGEDMELLEAMAVFASNKNAMMRRRVCEMVMLAINNVLETMAVF